MKEFSSVYQLLVDISTASMYVCFLEHFRRPDQFDLAVGDWEEIRAWWPGVGITSKCLFGVPVQTWSGLRHGQFRLRLDGEVVYAQE